MTDAAIPQYIAGTRRCSPMRRRYARMMPTIRNDSKPSRKTTMNACSMRPDSVINENDSHFQGWIKLNQVNSGAEPQKAQRGRSPICSEELQRIVRHCHRTPHMSHRTAVVPESFLRVFEVAADDVDKGIDFHDHPGLERIQVVHRNQPRFHVPLVVLEHLVIGLDV